MTNKYQLKSVLILSRVIFLWSKTTDKYLLFFKLLGVCSSFPFSRLIDLDLPLKRSLDRDLDRDLGLCVQPCDLDLELERDLRYRSWERRRAPCLSGDLERERRWPLTGDRDLDRELQLELEPRRLCRPLDNERERDLELLWLRCFPCKGDLERDLDELVEEEECL